jgi:ABC-type dipeptide/oligopeptide/nickel transport system permease subunit
MVTSRLLLHHILSNFASALISLLALEMGAMIVGRERQY